MRCPAKATPVVPTILTETTKQGTDKGEGNEHGTTSSASGVSEESVSDITKDTSTNVKPFEHIAKNDFEKTVSDSTSESEEKSNPKDVSNLTPSRSHPFLGSAFAAPTPNLVTNTVQKNDTKQQTNSVAPNDLLAASPFAQTPSRKFEDAAAELEKLQSQRKNIFSTPSSESVSRFHEDTPSKVQFSTETSEMIHKDTNFCEGHDRAEKIWSSCVVRVFLASDDKQWNEIGRGECKLLVTTKNTEADIAAQEKSESDLQMSESEDASENETPRFTDIKVDDITEGRVVLHDEKTKQVRVNAGLGTSFTLGVTSLTSGDKSSSSMLFSTIDSESQRSRSYLLLPLRSVSVPASERALALSSFQRRVRDLLTHLKSVSPHSS